MQITSKVEKGESTTKFVVLGDRQIPFHDTRAIRLARRVIEDFQPDYVVDLGDALDLPDLSTKYAPKPEHKMQFKSALRIYREQTEKEIEACPTAKRIWIAGNHEQRLEKYVSVKAEALWELLNDDGPLTLPKLVGIEDKVTYVQPYGEAWAYRWQGAEFLFKHGDRHNKFASSSELSDLHTNGISGHLHRIQMMMQQTYSSLHGWWSNGCLCNIEGQNCPPGYMSGTGMRNWQQGLTTIIFSNERPLFSVSPWVIHRGKTIVNGKVYIDTGGK